LLVVAAMYIVIGQVIPMVKYLSYMDNFIMIIFSTLSLMVAVGNV
jgi:hypothetical protein